jgi:hypothetical protein
LIPAEIILKDGMIYHPYFRYYQEKYNYDKTNKQKIVDTRECSTINKNIVSKEIDGENNK